MYKDSSKSPKSLEASNVLEANGGDGKPNPLCISLLLNGRKMINWKIDLGASNHIVPMLVAKSLGLTLTKTFGRCYLMDGKQVPIMGQVKDA